MIKEINKIIDQVLKEQRNETLTFESDPIEYIIQKFPSLDATMIDLMTEVYKDFITGIYIMAPKPTTFKILLHNGHYFYLIYNPKGYICKVSGKKYNLIDLKDEEYAIKAIANLLLLGIPPGSEGPKEEVTNENDPKNSFVSDMTSEPDLGGDLDLDLDGLDTNPDEELPADGAEPEDEINEEIEEPTKQQRFRIVKKNLISEIKVIKPHKPINASYFKDAAGYHFIDVYDIPTYGRFNKDKSKIMFTLSGVEYVDGVEELKKLLQMRSIPFEFVEAGFHDGIFYIDTKYFKFNTPIS